MASSLTCFRLSRVEQGLCLSMKMNEGGMMDKQHLALTQEEALELLAYLLTSAQGCIGEPADYGVYRLVTAAERLD